MCRWAREDAENARTVVAHLVAGIVTHVVARQTRAENRQVLEAAKSTAQLARAARGLQKAARKARRKAQVDANAQARIREQEKATAAAVKAERTANRVAKMARRKALMEANPQRAAAGAIKWEGALHARRLAAAKVSLLILVLAVACLCHQMHAQGLH